MERHTLRNIGLSLSIAVLSTFLGTFGENSVGKVLNLFEKRDEKCLPRLEVVLNSHELEFTSFYDFSPEKNKSGKIDNYNFRLKFSKLKKDISDLNNLEDKWTDNKSTPEENERMKNLYGQVISLDVFDKFVLYSYQHRDIKNKKQFQDLIYKSIFPFGIVGQIRKNPEEKREAIKEYLKDKSIKEIVELTEKIVGNRMLSVLGSFYPKNHSDGLDPGEILEARVGVCRHYSSAFVAVGQYLTETAGIDNLFFSNSGGFTGENSLDINDKPEGHAWVEIAVIEKNRVLFTYVDPTWSDPSGAFNAYNEAHFGPKKFSYSFITYITDKLIQEREYKVADKLLRRVMVNYKGTNIEKDALFELAKKQFFLAEENFNMKEGLKLTHEYLDRFSGYDRERTKVAKAMLTTWENKEVDSSPVHIRIIPVRAK